ncbi:hypothetical protein Tco_0900806 [Tanacetum coccineum]
MKLLLSQLFLHSTQTLTKSILNPTLPVKLTIPSLNPSVEREIIQQEIHNLQEAINNAQHVQDSLIPHTSITNIQIPPPFYPISTSIQTPLYGPSFPSPNVFGPLDQSL